MNENIKPGIYPGISNHDYHTGPGISKSGLDLVNHSPAHLAEARSNTEPKEATRAQMIGTAFHSLLLEPEQFALEYVQPLRREDYPNAVEDREVLVAEIEKLNADRLDKLPVGGAKAELVARIIDEIHGGDGEAAGDLEKLKASDLKQLIVDENEKRPGKLKTSGSRHEMQQILKENGVNITLWSDIQAGFFARNEGKAILSDEDWQMLHRMRDAVMAHPAAKFLLQHATDVVVDVKTCEDASPEAFARSIANWRYHVQHPFYLDGLRQALEQSGHQAPANGAAELSAYWTDPKTGVLCRCRPDFWRGQPKYFIFLAVEKSACVVNGVAKGVALYKLREESVELGREAYRKDLDRYAYCEKNNHWPGYSAKIEPIDLPAWVFARAENQTNPEGIHQLNNRQIYGF